MTVIRDAATSKGMLVDDRGYAHTYAITESQFTSAALLDSAYNINTGLISVTGTGDHSVLYFKNDEAPVNGESRMVIDAIALWCGTRSGTVTDDVVWTVLKNPDGGDIITDATPVDVTSNSDFGGNNALSSASFAYKGKNTGTVTSSIGTHGILAGTGRLFATLPIVLHKGNSIGIKVDINTSGTANVYAALIVRRIDGKIGL